MRGGTPPIFWSIFPPKGERAEKRWAVLCAAMAHDPTLHTSGVQTGRALAESGLNERRFQALLRARDSTLHHLVRTLGHYLAAKRVRIDWGDIAWLLVDEGSRPRKKLARAFYAAAHDKKNG